jgi:DNA-binding response OmpR family regulator
MSGPFTVFVVDDDAFVLEAMRGILESECTVRTFASADECRPELETASPDMFLLDVRMPGTDGYDFCREIKDNYALRHIPVTFISAQDTIDARLSGYDAGGEDFIVKPFEVEEVRRKVVVAQQIAAQKRSLRSQADDAEMLSSLVMANMDEYAILVQFVRKLISFETERDIAEGVLDLLQRYRLEGVAQTRISGRTLTLSAQGSNLPLEVSVIEHVRNMGRIFEFRSRSAHNFDRLTMMINNMPVSDPEFCGRLRDHLCIAAECAEARLKAIENEEANRRQEAGIRDAVERIAASTATAREAYLRDRAASTELLMRLEMDLTGIFAHMELSPQEERSLNNVITTFSANMLALIDAGEETQKAMEDLGRRLGKL